MCPLCPQVGWFGVVLWCWISCVVSKMSVRYRRGYNRAVSNKEDT